jgi:hypothetical protein
MGNPRQRRTALIALAVLVTAVAAFALARTIASDEGDDLPPPPAAGEAGQGPEIESPGEGRIPKLPPKSGGGGEASPDSQPQPSEPGAAPAPGPSPRGNGGQGGNESGGGRQPPPPPPEDE